MRRLIVLSTVLLCWQPSFAQDRAGGLRGDPEAIADAEAMVETMGGMEIWGQLKSVHFVHEWFPWYREAYVEHEILDLTGPRSWVEMKSEIYHRLRAYSPEHGYWNVVNGEFPRVSVGDQSVDVKHHFARTACAEFLAADREGLVSKLHRVGLLVESLADHQSRQSLRRGL